MVKPPVPIARLVTIRTVPIRRVVLVKLVITVIKCFKAQIHRVKYVYRVPTLRPLVYQVPRVVTIVHRASIQRKKETPWKANAMIVQQTHLVPTLGETCRATHVKKEQHHWQVKPFVLPATLVPIYEQTRARILRNVSSAALEK